MYYVNSFELARLSSKHENIDCILHKKYIFKQLLDLHFIKLWDSKALTVQLSSKSDYCQLD